jgi:CRP-like cAMP-binding protein
VEIEARSDAVRTGGASASRLVQRALVLKSFPGFVGLTAVELTVLASISRERLFKKGIELLRPGAPVQCFYLVLDGEVQMLRRGTPTQVMRRGESVGGLAALTEDPEGAHAVALSDTVVLEIDREDMQDVFEDHFEIMLGVMRALARTLRDMQRRVGGAAVVMRREFESADASRPLGVVDKLFLLRHATSFGGGSIEALAAMAARAPERRFAPGEAVWRHGDPSEGSMLIAAGIVACQPRDEPGFDFGPGMVMGGLDSIGGEPRWYDAVAKTQVLGLWLAPWSLYDTLEDHPEMAMGLMRTLARGIVAMWDRLAQR